MTDRVPNPEAGSVAWRSNANHNRMMALAQDLEPPRTDEIELAYFGSSAFRITTPKGLTILIDPWRNHPLRRWDWYLADMPMTCVDIGISTHAHFDHDALNRLDAHVLLDRLIGAYRSRMRRSSVSRTSMRRLPASAHTISRGSTRSLSASTSNRPAIRVLGIIA